MFDKTGIILAGGDSRRMGQNKAFLFLNDKPLIEIVMDRMLELFTEVIVVVNDCPLYEKYNQKIVVKKDIIPGCGPLGGIYTGLMSSHHKHNFVIACDMPFFNVKLISHMIKKAEDSQALVPEYDGKWHPLFALYNKNCTLRAKEQIVKQNFRLKDFLKCVETKIINESEVKEFDLEGRSFININTRDEYKLHCSHV